MAYSRDVKERGSSSQDAHLTSRGDKPWDKGMPTQHSVWGAAAAAMAQEQSG